VRRETACGSPEYRIHADLAEPLDAPTARLTIMFRRRLVVYGLVIGMIALWIGVVFWLR
jgi:hypothetical protein